MPSQYSLLLCTQDHGAEECWAEHGFLHASEAAKDVARRARGKAQKQDAELKRLRNQVRLALLPTSPSTIEFCTWVVLLHF